jgi:hypothetical protein
MSILEKYKLVFDLIESATDRQNAHIEQELANKDINSKVVGNVVKVHKDNLDKARSMVKKMGFSHKVEHGLNEESEEQIDEISKKALGNYVNYSADDLRSKTNAASYINSQIQGKDKSTDLERIEAVKKLDHSKDKRQEGIARAVRKLTSEETIDEISRETVDSYLDKSKKAPLKPQETFDRTIERTLTRLRGRERANDRVHTDELKKIRSRLGLKEDEIVSESKASITLAKLDAIPDHPIVSHKSPYEGAEVGEYTERFMGSKSAQRFAKFIAIKGGKVRLGKRGRDTYVYHKGAGPLSHNDMMKTIEESIVVSSDKKVGKDGRLYPIKRETIK